MRASCPSYHRWARTVAIDDSAFAYSSLASLTFENNSKLSAIGNSAFTSTKLSAVVLPTSLREIGDSAFANCYSLITVTLPEGLISVGREAFRESSSLVTVNLPSTLQTLGICAFEDCYGLKNVNFARNSVIQILYVGTFEGCTGLESIELPASLTEIPNRGTELFGTSKYYGLFSECSSLKRVTFEEGSKLTKIGNYAFSETALESFTFPSSVASVGEYAFQYTKLTTLTIPATVTSLGAHAFYGCEELVSVTLGSGIKTLPSGVFGNCYALTAFTVPATVTSIDSSAFSSCDAIDGFKVDPANQSFRERDGVVYDLDWNIVLFPSSKTTYTIPAGTKKLPEDFFTDYTFDSIEIEEGNTSFLFDENGVLYDAGMTTILFFPETVEEYVIPATIPSSMTPAAFFELLSKCKADGALTTVTVSPDNKDCKSFFDDGVIYYNDAESGWVLAWIPSDLTELKIPKEVSLLTCIGEEGPFYGSALKTVTFEAGRTKPLTLASYIFYGARNLESVSLPDNTVSIGNYAFYNCTSLRELVLPASVTEIGGYAFYNCKALTKLVIPTSVTYIGNRAFYKWQTTQTICVSFAENAVPDTFDSRWLSYCYATVVYSYTGE